MRLQIIGLSLFLVLHQSIGWTFVIAQKQRVLGPAIHSTYFMTPNNNEVEVAARAQVGQFVNGSCQYSTVYDLGKEKLKTGDNIDYDAFAIKRLIGNQYTCMNIQYIYRQTIKETFLLMFDGINYSATYPQTSQVSIL